MAITFQPQNPSFRKKRWLLRLAGWLLLMHSCAAVLLYGFAISFGVL